MIAKGINKAYHDKVHGESLVEDKQKKVINEVSKDIDNILIGLNLP